MHVLALCAGIGGLEIGLKLATKNAARTVAIVEREGYCASVLRARMQDGFIDDCPIWSDVKTFDAEPWRGRVDCITAGFPCQPFSTAGRRKGQKDPRHLWPYIATHVRVLLPTYVFCENVPGHLSLGFHEVSAELSEMGYRTEAGIFSAAEVGAPHLRKRLFFLAHLANAGSQPIPEQYRRRGRPRGQGALHPAWNVKDGALANADGSRRRPECAAGQRVEWPDDGLHAVGAEDSCRFERGGQLLANTDGHRLTCGRPIERASPHAAASERREHPRCTCSKGPAKSGLGKPADGPAFLVDYLARAWPTDWEDGVPRVVEKQAHRVDRLRALGNAVVPQTAALAWTTLMQQAIKNGHTPL